MKLPDRAGETLYFPAGADLPERSRGGWIEISQNGDDDLEFPAPSVTLTAGGSGHGASDEEAARDSSGHGEANEGADDETSEEAADGETGDSDVATQAAAPSSDGSGTDTLTIVALIAGLLGLAAGVGALVTARRP